MNIDDLKGAWGQDKPAGMEIPGGAALHGKTMSVVAKLRKKMKGEFIATLVAYVLLVCYIIFMYRVFNGVVQGIFFLNTVSILGFIMILINGYFFGKFYIFYRSASRYDLDMAASIRKITYELELNMEIYKTYSICMMPVSVLMTFTLVGGKNVYDFLIHILATSLLFSFGMIWIFLTVFAGFVITWFFINLHIRLQYGRQAAELKQIIADLGEGA